MKLAEALPSAQTPCAGSNSCAVGSWGNARYQEGEEPTEDASALLEEVGHVLEQLEH